MVVENLGAAPLMAARNMGSGAFTFPRCIPAACSGMDPIFD